TAGTLPSRRVVLHGVRSRGSHLALRYYDPLGLPLHSGRLRLRLIRLASPRRGPCRRVSRVPHRSLHACCAPYPAGATCALRISRRWCCLRREMTGSAPGLFLCRGCRLHFMLRPACLLPAARLLPPDGLLTPRSTARVSPGRLGPATRCSDACRGGTLTRWRGAACDGQPSPSRGPASFASRRTIWRRVTRLQGGEGALVRRSHASSCSVLRWIARSPESCGSSVSHEHGGSGRSTQQTRIGLVRAMDSSWASTFARRSPLNGQ